MDDEEVDRMIDWSEYPDIPKEALAAIREREAERRKELEKIPRKE